MNRFTKTSVASVMLSLMALSSFASGNQKNVRDLTLTVQANEMTAPTIVSKKTTLNSGEFAKYQLMGAQSQYLAKHEAAGASSATKDVLIVVGIAVVVLIIVGVSSYHPMSGVDYSKL